MADFTSSGWSVYIMLVTAIALVACFWLTVSLSKGKAPGEQVGTTGHKWDETLEEYNNPLPRWWIYLFYITIIFAIVYLVLYPGFGSYKGTFGWTQIGQYEAEVKKVDERVAPLFERFSKMEIQQVAADPEGRAMGERLFLTYCVQCHGSDARGSKGFPNLTDDDWLWGGSLEQVTATITNGRQGVMPPMAAAVGTSEDVRNVANYVLSLSDSPHNSVAAQLGKSKFVACAACHGADGKGNVALGAPNLTDKVWLHGWGDEFIIGMVNTGKTNVMPAQTGRLTPEQIHVLAGYVLGLSQGTALAAK
jgi:cytochrome c oxidase cbb3-type subunit 3